MQSRPSSDGLAGGLNRLIYEGEAYIIICVYDKEVREPVANDVQKRPEHSD